MTEEECLDSTRMAYRREKLHQHAEERLHQRTQYTTEIHQEERIHMTMKMELVDISPDLATKLLEGNTNDIDFEDCSEFFGQLSKNSAASHSVMLLSRWADQRSKADTGIIEQRVQMIYFIKAWNQFRADDDSGQFLRWSRTEKFPVPA